MRARAVLVAAALAAGGSPSSEAAVQPPVLKWAYGGCSGSPGSYACPTGWYASPAVADLDGDGQPEAIWGGYDLAVVNGATGALRASAANGSRIWPGVAVADLTGDGTLEIAVGRGSDQLTVYRPGVSAGTMTLATLWTRNPFGGGEVRTLAVSDLDGDGPLELIVGRASGGATRQVSAYDAAGNLRPGWPARHDGEPGYGWGMYNENVAVADLDGDGLKEVYAPTDTHYITALDRNGGQLTVHPRYTGRTYWSEVGVHVDDAADLRGYANCGTEHRPNFANSAPSVADLDGDGTLELVVPGDVYDCALGDPDGDLYHLPWILKRDRTRWSGSGYDWTVIPTAEPGSGPLSQDYNVIENDVQNAVLADLDGDGQREILFPSYDGRLHAFWLDKTEHGAWPVTIPTVAGGGDTFRFASEPAVADLDDDGQAEVIVASWPQKIAGLRGELLIYSSQGVLLQRLAMPAPALYGDNWNGALGAPTLADVDGDADLEVVLGTRSSGIVAYDLPGTAGARVLWGTGRGSLRRTGAQAAGPLAVSDAAATEGTGTGGTLTFTVSLARAGDQPVSVRYATSPGSATPGVDYTPVSGTLSFAPGATTRTVSVPLLGDALDEWDETVLLTLGSPAGTTIADGTAVGTILDDDPLPSLSVADVSVVEGTGGSQSAVFTLTLSPASGRAVDVQAATADWTALAGLDYQATSVAVRFDPGQTSRQVPVPVVTDALDEPWETFGLSLFDSPVAVLADAGAQGLIQDDDPTPVISVSDASGPEGQAGWALQAFDVGLTGLSAGTVSVGFGTAPGSASAGVDYQPVAGTLTWAPGTNATKTVWVPVAGDRLAEANETYALGLSAPVAASLPDPQGLGTILDDDAGGLSVDDARVVEPRSGQRSLGFTISLAPSNPSTTVTVDWTAVGVTATAGDDFVAASGTASFPPGASTSPVSVAVLADALAEGQETLRLDLSNASGAAIAVPSGTGTIVEPPAAGDFNADGQPDILWRHALSGRNVVWLMNGRVRLAGSFTSPDLRDPAWRVVGTPDLDRDGRSDILWHHPQTGALDAWLMNGVAQSGATQPLSPASEPDTTWNVVGTGDFDGDLRPDLFWRNSASGGLRLWLMNGLARVSQLATTPAAVTDLGWVVVGVGDFSGDGRPDVLWRHQLSGRNVVWVMNGAVRESGVFTTPDAFTDLYWKMAGAGDYDQDGWPDILWRHALSGRNVVWHLRGTVRVNGGYTTPDQLADPNWQIVGPR